ncbi:MAG TPA: acetaldehyde dehydrogenase (acetylating) [Solirubrobacterales bacterium]|nr:acetaldehyde dehydrogenase (acetylating) [Solirubrobacterales bacterium]
MTDSERPPLRVGIAGSGNIGTDLMLKIARSPVLELAGMAGIDPGSDGLARAARQGHWTTSDGLADLLAKADDIDLVFDATSAKAHRAHAEMLAERGIKSVDLTPAAIGPAVIPAVNLEQYLGEADVNLVTCGAQATVPIVAAVSRVAPVSYAEIVSTISARSAGPGTRQNIDEFTLTTARALETVGGAARGKAIILLNPADPPVVMRNTVFADVGDVDLDAVSASIEETVAAVSAYVPGYRLTAPPLLRDGTVTALLEVRGAGDYLPEYAGNLDIMTSAAVRVAELHARAGASR